MRLIRSEVRSWVDPLAVAAGLGDQDWRLCLLSDGGPHGRWSYVAARPDAVDERPAQGLEAFARLRDLLGDRAPRLDDGPPFQGGVVGLAAYDLGAPPREDPDPWPGLILARYPAVLAFDHARRAVVAIGRGDDGPRAQAAVARALSWLDQATEPVVPGGALTKGFEPERPDRAYREAVANVVERIAAGELFQANIARGWRGRLNPDATPFDLFVRLAGESRAPYAAFWALPGLALVSNSPEAFLAMTPDGAMETRPIKGTRPRGTDPAADAAFAAELTASEKDRAENLMIVDLMRNDLSRVCRPGTVTVEGLFAVERYATVQHLVSTVRGQARAGVDAADALMAAFPPGSITGAPKHQAMKVIAGHEPPRGPWCGTLLLVGADGALQSSVLIRTVALTRDEEGWTFRTLAGAGVVADSDPQGELDETEAKIASIRRALTERR